jgi:hypothetical protein
MTDTDRRIRDALSADDEAFLDSLDKDRGLFVQIGEMFRGPMRWLTVAVNLLVLAATAVGIWAIVKMLGADDTRALILWAAFGWAAWTIQLALKQWLWDRMNTLGILRELKRIELRIARLEEGGQA